MNPVQGEQFPFLDDERDGCLERREVERGRPLQEDEEDDHPEDASGLDSDEHEQDLSLIHISEPTRRS